MKERIKKVTIFRKDLYQQNTENRNKGKLHVCSEYDEEGRIVVHRKYDPDGSLEEKTDYTYDDAGNIIEESMSDSEEDFVEKKVFDRDERGKIISGKIIYMDGSEDMLEYKYNQSGKVESISTVNDEGEVEARQSFDYSDDGQITAEYEYDEDDELVSYRKYKFDNEGNQVEVIKWEQGTEEITDRVKSEDSGNTEKILSYDSANRLIAKKMTLKDEQGNAIQVEEEDQYRKYLTEYQYDDRNQLTEQKMVDREGNLINHVTRDYDKNGKLKRSEILVNTPGISRHEVYLYDYELYPQP